MDELKAMRIWVCWNLTADKNGRKTKVPCAANGGATGSDAAHAHTWVTFAEAMAASSAKEVSGVGFIIPRGFFFLDIDNRAKDDPWVETLLSRFGTYSEFSYSGSGLHLYGRCDYAQLPIVKDEQGRDRLARRYYTKNPNNGLELYIGGLTNRFAVYTGNEILQAATVDCTQAILTTLEQDMKRKQRQHDVSIELADDAECFDIICNLRKDANSAKFIRLFDHGDITGFASQSEADASLCAMIAFRAGNHPAAIDAVFRQSALYREEKWSRQDYRDATIACGIAACRGVFHYSVREKPGFIVYNPSSKKEEVVCTLLARHFREHVHYVFVRDDARNGVLRYVYDDGVYRLYSDDMLKGLIKSLVMAYSESLVRMSQINEAFAQITTDIVFTTMQPVKEPAHAAA